MAENPEKFIFRDASLVPMFDLLRSSGKRVFLVTNSLWDYTNVVMNFLCEGRVGADRNLDWLRHFDLARAGGARTARRAPRASFRRRARLHGLMFYPRPPPGSLLASYRWWSARRSPASSPEGRTSSRRAAGPLARQALRQAALQRLSEAQKSIPHLCPPRGAGEPAHWRAVQHGQRPAAPRGGHDRGRVVDAGRRGGGPPGAERVAAERWGRGHAGVPGAAEAAGARGVGRPKRGPAARPG